MSKQQKQYAIIAAAAIGLYLIYRWYQNNSANSSSTTGTTATDASGTDYATLAGQEQSDAAGLQNQEQTDVAGLTSGLAASNAQETSDVNSLTGLIGGLTTGLSNLTGQEQTDVGNLGQQIAALGTGSTQGPSPAVTITTHPGGAFAKYYKTVTGKNPPAQVQVSNFLYQAWKSGVKATALKPSTHPSAPRQKQVAHPNPTHAQQTHTKPTAAHPANPGKVGTTSRPAQKVTNTHKATKPSGKRK